VRARTRQKAATTTHLCPRRSGTATDALCVSMVQAAWPAPLRTLAGDGGHCGGRAWRGLGSCLSVGRPHRCGDANADVGAVVGGWLVGQGPPGPVEGGDHALYRIPRPLSPLFTFDDRRPPLPAVGLPWWDCATSTLPLTWGLQRTWRQYLPVLWRERPGGESRCARNLSNIPCSRAATTC
jgi:hypothetical protein